MWNSKRSAGVSAAVCFVFAVILTAGLFLGPWAAKMWLCYYRGMPEDSAVVARMIKLFVICFYPCAIFAYVTLYSLIRMLWNIRKDAIFIPKNVRYLRRISWCCIAVAVISFVCGIQYIPYLFISVAAGFVGLMLRVVKNVMETAVELKAENELTI